MTTYSIYNKATGEFLGREIQTTDLTTLASFTPDGCAAMPGSYDYLRQRVNMQTGAVEAWESPRIAELAAQALIDAARRALEVLDVKALRALSDLVVSPNDPQALQRVLDIEVSKEQQRAIIRGSK